jgi:hypothetical protein
MIKELLLKYFNFNEEDLTEDTEYLEIKLEDGSKITFKVEQDDELILADYVYTDEEYEFFAAPIRVIAFDIKTYIIDEDITYMFDADTVVISLYGIYFFMNSDTYKKMVVHAK